MKANINHITDSARNEIIECLDGMSIYEMTVWVRDHAQYLKWICNYNATMLDTRMQAVMFLSHFLNTNYRGDQDVIENFRGLCVACVIDLETNCK